MADITEGDRVRVLWPAKGEGRFSLPECWYEGKCLDVQQKLVGKTSKQIYHVKFDDGQLFWVPTVLNERIERIGATQHSGSEIRPRLVAGQRTRRRSPSFMSAINLAVGAYAISSLNNHLRNQTPSFTSRTGHFEPQT